jgi:hypothetical protein
MRAALLQPRSRREPDNFKQPGLVRNRVPRAIFETEQGATMKNIVLAAAIVSLGAIGLAGCDVKKTQEGSVTVPKYEVEKTQQGNVTLPKYDVTTPDVKVGSTEKQVTVPTVQTEKRTIEVPTVKITPADEKQAKAQADAQATSKQ